jgi:SAM-dependent methyltransferase
LRRAVHYLAAEAGISQFLDIGTGLPAQGSVHEIARTVNPDSRVVYVDNDEVVVAHGRALLASASGVRAVEGDLRYPRELIGRKEVREVLDFTQPVAVLLVAVLHFLGDAESPWQAVTAITRRLAPGSYLVVSHVTGDDLPAAAVDRARDIYASALVQGTARRRTEILRFFEGLELTGPGLVDVAAWPSECVAKAAGPVLLWAGIGRKP